MFFVSLLVLELKPALGGCANARTAELLHEDYRSQASQPRTIVSDGCVTDVQSSISNRPGLYELHHLFLGGRTIWFPKFHLIVKVQYFIFRRRPPKLGPMADGATHIENTPGFFRYIRGIRGPPIETSLGSSVRKIVLVSGITLELYST